MPIGHTTRYRIPYLMRGSKPGEIAAQSQQIAESIEGHMASGELRGPAGPAGLPGVNAVPADTAVAGYIGAEGSATRAAVAAAIGQMAAPPAAVTGHMEFTASFDLPTSTNNDPVRTRFVLDSAASDPGMTFAAAGNSVGTLQLEKGAYAILYFADCGASMGAGGGRLAITTPDAAKTYLATVGQPDGWEVSLAHPALYLPSASTTAFTVRQRSDFTRRCNVRVSIQKLK